MKKVILVILALSLLGAGCKKAGEGVSLLSKINWPEVCAEKELPKGFPKEYLFADSLTVAADSVGVSGEVRSTGEQLGGQDGWVGSFCVQAGKEEVIGWYDKKLEEMGYKKLGETDGEYIFEKGKTTVNVSAYDISEGFSLYSFNIMTANF